MCILIVYFSVLCLYWIIKDAVNEWKEKHRNKCPFCGAYLHGYQTAFDKRNEARYCSRCGTSLNKTENTFDPIKFRKELRSLLLCSNEYRKKKNKKAWL